MLLSVKKRDGPARIGELLIDNKRVITPNLLFVNTSRFKAPDFADIFITNNKPREKKPTLQISNYFVYTKDIPKELHLIAIKQYKKENKKYYVLPGNKDIINDAIKDNPAILFIISNAYQLFQQPKNFVNFIVELKEKIDYEKLIYLPSIGDPTNFALLTYMGIDFFDSISAITAARDSTFLFSNGRYNKNDLNELPCSCPSCSKYKGAPCDMRFKDILNHNYFVMLDEIKQVRNAINRGDLRGLVEIRVKSSPNLTAIFRNLDANHYDFLENRTSITGKSMVLATCKESFFRPEIRRFQKRVIEQYLKPVSAKILLLLPCSAKKPYSFSKSHKLFRERLDSSGNPFVVHEVIVTSPIGLVPRELELVYPASSYDIPVTGVWDEDEKKMIRKLLTEYLRINKYDRIIAHLPKGIMEFIGDILENPTITCIDDPTSKKSLEELSTVLNKNVNSYGKVNPQERLREDVQGFAFYQFGKKIADTLLKDCIIKGKYPYLKIMYNNTQLGMIVEERGLISLTINGAERVAKSNKYWVEIYDDFTLKGSVFAPGIKDAYDDIRIGDEVIVIKNKKLCAVGVAQMSGDEMKKSSHGEAVKVRHKV
jgi:archaeosine synthase